MKFLDFGIFSKFVINFNEWIFKKINEKKIWEKRIKVKEWMNRYFIWHYSKECLLQLLTMHTFVCLTLPPSNEISTLTCFPTLNTSPLVDPSVQCKIRHCLPSRIRWKMPFMAYSGLSLMVFCERQNTRCVTPRSGAYISSAWLAPNTAITVPISSFTPPKSCSKRSPAWRLSLATSQALAAAALRL